MKSDHMYSKINVTKNAMKLNYVRLIFMAVLAMNGTTLLGQQQASLVAPSAPTGSGSTAAKPAPAAPGPHKLGPLGVTLNWRFRSEAGDFFEPPSRQNAYSVEHYLLR